MSLSHDIISEFVKVTNNNKEKPKEGIVYATIVQGSDGKYVKIDGSDLLTPADTTTDIEDGERVTVMIKDHKATVTGNVTAPSASGNRVDKVVETVTEQIGVFETVVADKVSTNELEAYKATIEYLVAGKAEIEDLEAINATIENLKVKDAEIENAVIDKATIEDLEAVNAKIENLEVKDAEIENAVVENLEATKADIQILNADFAQIKTLVSGNLTSDNILSFNITADKVTMEDAFIKDAMIANVNAAKINAGRINTNSVVIGSEDGGMSISGATQQFTDKNGNVRIQIGRDASDDFTFALYGEDGRGQLINQNGITASAISDGIIVNDMISDDASISGGKLDISSVIMEINDDDSTTIKSNKIYLDEQNQSLEVAFKSLKTQVDTIKDIDSDLTTITDKIQSNTSKIEANKSSISTLLAEDAAIKKQVTDLEGNVVETTNTLTSKYTSLQQNLDGFKTTVNNTYATKTSVNDVKNNLSSNYSTTSAMNSAIQQKVDAISASVSSTYATKNEVKTVDDNIKANYSTTEQMESAISVAKNEINLGVSKVYETKTEVSNKIGGAIDKVLIGGRNLIIRNTETKNYYIGTDGSLSKADGYGVSDYIKVDSGESLAFSKKDSATTDDHFRWAWYGNDKTYISRTPNNSNKFIWAVPSGAAYVRISYPLDCYPKVERGTKHTDWTPAPEDVDTSINNAITTSKDYTDSQIKISKDAIELGVSQTYETKTSVTSQISNTLTSAKSYADTKKSEAISTASSDATSKANNALNSAKSYADTKKSEAITSANNTLNTTIANYYTKTQTDSQIKVAKDAINLGVSETYETKTNVTSKVNSAISTASSDASTKANNALNSAKSYADTKKSEAITSANNTLNSTIANYYTKAQTDSQIKIAKDAIDLSVKNTYETKANVQSQINSIQVGSRNLVQNSTFNSTNGWSIGSGWSVNKTEKFRDNNSIYINRSGLTADGWTELRSNPVNVKQGEKIVGSWYIKYRDCDMSSIVCLWGYKADGSNRVDLTSALKLYGTNTNWTRYVLKGTVPANVDHVRLAISHRRNGIIYAAMPQLEYGNTATDWSPSPVDVSNDISQAKSDAIASANNTLNTTIANYYTKAQTDSQIKIAKDAINLGVSQTYETKTNVTSKVNSAISTASSDASTKANNALTSAKSYADTKKSEAITSANNTLNTTIANYYTKSQTDSQIKVAKDAIDLSVKNTYETKTEVSNKINNIQVGGRNLMLKTDINKFGIGLWVNNGGTGVVEGTYVDGTKTIKVTGNSGIYYNRYIRLKRDTIYTYSMMIKPSTAINVGSLSPLHMWLSTSESSAHLETVISSSGTAPANIWTKVWITFKTPNTQDTYYMRPFLYEIGSRTVYMTQPQVEEGNKASSWMSALEDTQTSIDTAKSEAIASANNTLNSTIANYYTKAQTDSQIKIAKDAINLGVSQTYETKTNVTSKVNSAISTASSDASTKANNALNSAKSYADTKKSEAITSANNTLNSTIANYYTKSQTDSQINVAKNAITSSVSSTYETKTNVQNKIDAIQVGGRNLAIGSKTATNDFASGGGTVTTASDLFGGVTAVKTNTAWSGRYFNLKAIAQRGGFKVGDKLVLSVYIKSDRNVTLNITAHRTTSTGNTAGSSKTYNNFTVTPTWKQVWFPFVADAGTLNRVDARIEVNIATDTNYIYWAGWKLEKGTVGTDWSPAPEEIETTVSNLTQRVSTAEQKITDTAITNVVKQNFYTKTETNNQITSKGYQTSSQVKQTVDALELKFTQSGGYNLIRNGKAAVDLKCWSSNGGGIQRTTDSVYKTCIKTSLPSGIKYNGGDSGSAIRLKNSTHYVYEAVIYSRTALPGTNVSPLHFWCGTSPSTPGTGQCSIVDYRQAVPTVNKWTKCYVHILTASSGEVWFTPFIYTGGSYTGDIWVTEISLSESSVETPYSPHASEIYDGVTTIDKDGVTVKSSNGAYTNFNNLGMNSFNNSGQQTLGIKNGGITFHPYNTNQLGAYVTQSALWSGSVSANGLAISTANNGTYISLGTSSLSDANTSLSMDQALTISASDNFQPKGINFWKNVHAHGYGIRQLAHLQLAGSSPIQFDYLNTSPSTIYEATSSGHSLYVMGGYQMHLGCMDGKGSPKGLIWMENSTNTHSYTHWNFHNYTMYNMKTATSYANTLTNRYIETYGINSNVDGIRYLYRNIELVDGVGIRNLPNGYKGCPYDIVSIVCKGRGHAWVECEDEYRFIINGDCKSVNVEIIIYPTDGVMTMSSLAPDESPTLEAIPERNIGEQPVIVTNEGFISIESEQE